jgi:hypothetical protein
MSFLTVGRIVSAKKQRYVDFDARVYDMKTGAQLKMTDLFAANSKAWNILAREVRRQLNAYFQGTQADAKRLNALCARANLEKALPLLIQYDEKVFEEIMVEEDEIDNDIVEVIKALEEY